MLQRTGNTTAAQQQAWQESLRQDGAVMDLFLMETEADAARCADDLHVVGAKFDDFVACTQADVLAALAQAGQ